MASTPPMPEHLPGFEILTKNKEAIRQLVNYAAILIPKLMARYKLIEKCWRWIKQSLHRSRRQLTTRAEMRQFVLEEWDKIPQKWINELIDKQEH
jgi:hypothetical protein